MARPVDLSKITLEVRSKSTADQVAEAIRDAILRGELRPLTPLREQSLAEELTVSRNSVREALRSLQAEGLADYRMHYGMVVASVSWKEADEIHQARLLVEVPAARVAHGDPQTLSELRRTVQEMSAAEKAGDHRAVMAADQEFHAILVRCLGLDRVSRFHETLQRELALANALLDHTETRSRAAADHRALVAAIASDPDHGAVAAHDHIHKAQLAVRSRT